VARILRLSALALGLGLLAGCASTAIPAPSQADLDSPDGPVTVPSLLRVEKFTEVYPFRTDPHAGLAEIKETGRPGMLYYADPG